MGLNRYTMLMEFCIDRNCVIGGESVLNTANTEFIDFEIRAIVQ